MDYWSQFYVYPYFHQNWTLFTPPPNENYKLFVSFKDNGLKKEELVSSILSEHQGNRFKGYEALVLALSNSIFYFEKNSVLQNPINGPIKNDLPFEMMKYTAFHYICFKQKREIQDLKIILLTENVKTKKQRVYFD